MTALCAVAIAGSAFAQGRGARNAQPAPAGGEVLMLEEIRIQVAPELPTVVVSIPRQKPEISSVALKKDSEDLITAGNAEVKPRLADLQVNRIEEPEKILAKQRAQ